MTQSLTMMFSHYHHGHILPLFPITAKPAEDITDLRHRPLLLFMTFLRPESRLWKDASCSKHAFYN